MTKLVTLLLVALLCGACGLKMEPTGKDCVWDQSSGNYGYWDCGDSKNAYRPMPGYSR